MLPYQLKKQSTSFSEFLERLRDCIFPDSKGQLIKVPTSSFPVEHNTASSVPSHIFYRENGWKFSTALQFLTSKQTEPRSGFRFCFKQKQQD